MPNGGIPPASVDEGVVMLSTQDAKLDVTGQPGANAVAALEVVRSTHRAIAEAYSVPPHEVLHDNNDQPESGVALLLRSKPKIDQRDERIEANKSAVDLVFILERSLLSLANSGNPPIPSTIFQQWDPGTLDIPMSDLDKISTIKAALDAALIDKVEAIRRYYNFETRDQALDLLSTMTVEQQPMINVTPVDQTKTLPDTEKTSI
jgi:hypothetical protein